MNTEQIFLTYDDIQLIPQYSEVKSRSHVRLNTHNSGIPLKLPIISSPMDTVTEFDMAATLSYFGAVGCIHRFMSIEDQVGMVQKVARHEHRMAAIGVNGDYLERALALVKDAGARYLLIDVAHGHHKNVKIAIQHIREILSEKTKIIAGSIATPEAALDLENWGADILRVGVGAGSLCSTRIKTGHGIPSVTSLYEISQVSRLPIIADGGIRTPGDVSKALAVGADFVMVGSMFAGTKEAPGKIIETPNGLYKRYRGSASQETKEAHGMKERNVEGESTIVPFKGSVQYILNDIEDGLRSACSYSGAKTLDEFKLKANWVRVTTSGILEAKPHLKDQR